MHFKSSLILAKYCKFDAPTYFSLYITSKSLQTFDAPLSWCNLLDSSINTSSPRFTFLKVLLISKCLMCQLFLLARFRTTCMIAYLTSENKYFLIIDASHLFKSSCNYSYLKFLNISIRCQLGFVGPFQCN
jgi:hypothetical protein